ncbi:2Fe-2S ferredoxin-type domain-containing protein [Massariosphaeria phaeospora]|uniref:2Fe-2S ferredoxin-type domain-containing protein n=1 Tax=Massariosphaeria phaeospora TaxID=100035 RepID=A0A7C8M4T4_9PLEO|nr:2Fe-2S ferredoxin-type domain-containing protein [Massariosphaeria phaeospora]
MPGAALSAKAFSRAVARCSLPSLHTSFGAPARIRQFSSQSSNWTPCSPASTAQRSRGAPSPLQLVPNVPSAIASVSIRTRDRRKFSSSPVSRHAHLDPPKPGEERKVTFIDKNGEAYTFEVADGDNLLDIAQNNDLEMEGACGGSCACSTCHVIVESDEYYDKMAEPDDDENDMLDLAFGLTETSRLGCQVKMSKELDGLVVKLPNMTRNLQASDFGSK